MPRPPTSTATAASSTPCSAAAWPWPPVPTRCSSRGSPTPTRSSTRSCPGQRTPPPRWRSPHALLALGVGLGQVLVDGGLGLLVGLAHREGELGDEQVAGVGVERLLRRREVLLRPAD